MLERLLEECPDCKGSGVVEVGWWFEDEGMALICPTCEAKGYIPHSCGEFEDVEGG